MGQKLRMVYNQLDKPVEEQLNQINMALQGIDGWGGAVRSSLVLNFTDDLDVDISSTSQTWVTIKGMTADFKPNNSLVQFIVRINLSCISTADLGLFIDDELVDSFTGNTTGNIMWTGFFEISAGVSHNINIQWKCPTGDAMTKLKGNQNKIQLVAINN